MLDSASPTTSSGGAVPFAQPVSPYSRRQQLFQELLKNNELLLKSRLEVRHLMSRDPAVIPPSMSFEEILSVVRERRLRHLLVCGRGGEVLGVISDHDLRARQGATAQQIMNAAVPSLAPETPLSPAITYLINENVSCMPVIDNGRLVGTLTTTDLMLTLQCMLQLWMRLAQVLQQEGHWAKELDKIVATLDGAMTPQQLSDKIARAREAIREEVRGVVDAVDLRTDVMTDMSTRAGLEEVLDMLLAVHKRFQQPFCLVLVAMDHFQHIQANCGETVARPLLKTVAWLIKESIRDCDFVARCREDAFAIVMPQSSLSEAVAYCQRLRQSAQSNHDLAVQPRITTCAVVPESGEDASRLLERAEASLE